jgi:hypothetical protein
MRRVSLGLLVGVVLLGALWACRPAGATVVVPVPIDSLARDADVVVVGRVTKIASYWEPRHASVFTRITLAVDEVWKGDGVGATLVVRQVGGQLPGRHAWVFGSPEFTRGEKVLVFLRRMADGALRVVHLYQGKFSVVPDSETGEELVHQPLSPAGVELLRAPGAPPAARTWRLRDARTDVLAAGGRGSPPPPPSSGAVLSPEAEDVEGAVQAAFTFLGPGRWSEPDAGLPVTVFTNADGEPSAPGLGFGQVRDALAAWTNVPGSSFAYADGGVTEAGGFRRDGVNTVSFRDPLGQIDPPSNCSGTLAIGGFFTNGEATQVNGVTFARIVEGDVVVADGWTACGFFYQDYENLAETLTHELGHVLGLGHSADPTATMAAVAHFDGRGATLTDDDRAGLAFIYPGTSDAVLEVRRAGSGVGSVTSDPPGIDCGSSCLATFPEGTVVRLVATPVEGSRFEGWTGACSGTGECVATLQGRRVVTATFGQLPRLRFSAAAYSVTERSRTAIVTVIRTGDTSGTVSVAYAADPGTAVPGLDYTPVSGTLTFSPGATSRTFVVPILDDTFADGPRTVVLSLSAPAGGAELATPTTALLTIVDDDVAGTIQFGRATYTVRESAGTARITVTRSGRANGVTVRYATSAGTAVPGADYQDVAGTLAFGAGETAKSFLVPIVNDTLADGPRTVILTLSDPGGGATLGLQSAAVLTIGDDDVAGTVQFSAATYTVTEGSGGATITVTRRGNASGVSVPYATSPGTAVPGVDYEDVAGVLTFGAGEVTKSFVVPVLANPLGSGPRTLTLTLGSPEGGAILGTRRTATLTIVE